jgi:hypothetical protein
MTSVRPPRHEPITWIPRGLNRTEASYYIGVSPTKFDELVQDGRMPPGKRIDGRVVWDRVQLDMAFSDIGAVARNALDDALQGRRASR